MRKRADFGQKGQKCQKRPKKAIFDDFGLFRPFSAPWGLPGPGPGRGFYINPSRRDPAVPREGSRSLGGRALRLGAGG